MSISVRLLKGDRSESSQALLEAVVDPAGTDPALQRIPDECLDSDIFDDDRFGTLELDRGADVYETDAGWMGESVALMLEASMPEDCDSALDVATGRRRQGVRGRFYRQNGLSHGQCRACR
ncbi:hypothetical protein [Halorhabdus rudnickae]|uniref:hypothetical protein n=1 Tax=Halorhabdus rudnickae TaxID=1775544 RepID=UPI001083429F|nr:hypothetical protein [Halorhabdus rudnickae]